MRKVGKISDAHVEAAHAHAMLADLATLDGAPRPGRKLFYTLRRHIARLPRGERHMANRHLDSPTDHGYTPSHDIRNIFRR